MKRICSILFAVGLLAGCEAPDTDPLYFGQIQTLGVSVGAGTAAPSGDLTVGYRGANVAVVPTASSRTGSEVRGIISENTSDALSTFGSFESATGTNSVSLGQFFSTGIPGQKLAEGMSCAAALKAANGQGVTCNLGQ